DYRQQRFQSIVPNATAGRGIRLAKPAVEVARCSCTRRVSRKRADDHRSAHASSLLRSQEMRRHVRENAKRYSPPGRVDDIRLQSFSVAYDYPVVFTRDAFGLDNRCLVDALTRREPGKRHRFAVFADDGVIAANPDLADRI